MNGFRDHQKRVREEARIAHFIESATAREVELANRQLQERNAKIGRRHRLVSLLPTVDYEAKHQRLIRLRQAGTNEWIQRHPSFTSWLTSPRSDCLCVYGIPGSGKSLLAASVSEHLMTISSSGSSAVCYYYCDYADASSLDLSHLVGSLVKQLLFQLPLAAFDEEFFKSCEETSSNAILIDRQKGLPHLLAYFQSVYVVLDGIDELPMEGQESCLELIMQILQARGSNVRVYVTSRREERLIRSALETFRTIDLIAESIGEDIALFVEAAIDSGFLQQNPVSRRPEVRQKIIEALVNGAEGMFLWVKFQLFDLREALTEAAIDDTLRALPMGLDQTYAKIIKRIYNGPGGKLKIETMMDVFRWVLCARRPLRIEELEEAVALRPTDTNLHVERIATNAGQNLVSACGNLINYDRTDRTVTFAHHTVQQYLCRSGPSSRSFYHDAVHLHRKRTEIGIGEICIAYLCFSDFETQLIKTAVPALLDRRTAEEAIWYQVPFSSHIHNVVKSLASWRKPTLDSKRPPMQFAMPIPTPLRTPSSLAKKYAMLSYMIDYWVFHTRHFSENFPCWDAFKKVTFTLQLGFEFRPWYLEHRRNTGVTHSTPPPCFHVYVWAMKKGIRSLLELFTTEPDLMDQLVDFLKTEPADAASRQSTITRDAITTVIGYDTQNSTHDSFWTSGLIYHIAARAHTSLPVDESKYVDILRFSREELLLRSENDILDHINLLFKESMLLAVENNNALALNRLLNVHISDIDQLSQALLTMIAHGHTNEFPIKNLLTLPLPEDKQMPVSRTSERLSYSGDSIDRILGIIVSPQSADAESHPLWWTRLSSEGTAWLLHIQPFFKGLIAIRLLAESPHKIYAAHIDDIVTRRLLRPEILNDTISGGLSWWLQVEEKQWNIFAVALQRAHACRKIDSRESKRIREDLLQVIWEKGYFRSDLVLSQGMDLLSYAVDCQMVSLVRSLMSDYMRILRGIETAKVMGHPAIRTLKTAMTVSRGCLEIMLEWQWPREIVARAMEGGMDQTIVDKELRGKLQAMAEGRTIGRVE
ncbi:hypothetical protein BDV96DRAFT_571800 [Lophiotrema nucula]|uniref:NACHT domain-containing protein n=1 Tax=Lophiotrema nucula TaxID=690887 RepID=A0A6A5ZDG1_9PLEO|nr:hypothetical protein BDV96DRAFT_571800 [Lophiotrema nucula]